MTNSPTYSDQPAKFAAQVVAMVARDGYVQGSLAASHDQALAHLRQRALVEHWATDMVFDVSTASVEQLDTLYRGDEPEEHTWVRIVELGIIPVTCPVPPMLEETLGYSGDASFVAFYWEMFGDELAWADGRRSVVGAHWYAWLSFLRHPALAGALARYNFGASDAEADYWLVLDRQNRQLAVASITEAKAILEFQWPPAPPIKTPVVLDTEDLARMLREFRPIEIDPAALEAAMQHQQEQLQALVAWLDRAASSRAE